MVNKKFLLGILVLALVFGMTVVGCGGDDDPPPPTPEPGTTASDPIDRIADTNLGTMTSPASGWRQLLDSINSNGEYVNLDLSACTMIGTSFNPDPTVETGKKYIVSIILPTVATSIEAGTISNPTFKNFSNLKSISGAKIETIGKSAFDYCISLKNASFPKTQTIGVDAFSFCSDLESISFPASAELGFSSDTYSNPFTYCKEIIFNLIGTGNLSVIENGKALVRNSTILLAYPSASGNVTLNNITALDGNVFTGCINLTDISLQNVTTVGSRAFFSCINIQDLTFPKATSIGSSAFSSCSRLQSVNLPLVTNIGSEAFAYCSNIQDITFPKATTIGDYAFSSSLNNVTVTMGNTAPTLGRTVLSSSSTARTVTVKIPSGATGYTPAASPFAGTTVTVSGTNTTVNWANGFRGGGWTGYAFQKYGDSYIDQNITLIIQQQ